MTKLSMTKLRTCGSFTFAPARTLRRSVARKLSFLKIVCMVAFCAATAMPSSAQVTFTTLLNFDGINGRSPDLNVLTESSDGNGYGTTDQGGENNGGTIFTMTPAGTLTTLYNFCSQTNCADGAGPLGSLVQAASGDFYGTTGSGGAYATQTSYGGTVFKVTPTGKVTTLYSFCALANCADGEEPFAGLVQGTNGNFYGTTGFGGANNAGTVFEITPAGKLRTLYSFCTLNGCGDGDQPSGALVQATNGNFYGEARYGGATGFGTIFEITPKGELTTLVSFDVANGSTPIGGLIQAADGNLYGVTEGSGASRGGGTVFKSTPGGNLTTLYNFCSLPNCADGDGPNGPLVQGTDGNFYGTTYDEGADGSGTAFEITPAGVLTTLYNFCSQFGCPDGLYPLAGLLQATDGTFYGTTSQGGPSNDGTIFSLSVGLGPFVKTQPTSALEGATVGIFGRGFSSSSVVQFGGVQATSVKLCGTTFLTATIPAGALTGSVTVTTGATTLMSNQQFRVTPQLLSFNPPSGPVGSQVTITGTGFTQTEGVGFGDDVPSEFTVNSDTQITATVPTGARIGRIGVETKGGTAVSSTNFTIN